jgi:hypothetical protein
MYFNTSARLAEQKKACITGELLSLLNSSLSFSLDYLLTYLPTRTSADVSVPRLAGFSLIT